MADIHFAPIQGHTGVPFIRCHAAVYGATDCYYTPFIRLEKGVPRRRDINSLIGIADSGLPLIPQIITASGEETDILVKVIREAGFNHIDINMGCPFPLQTRKGRGTALLGNLGALKEVTEVVNSYEDITFSAKIRIGMERQDEWRASLPLLNSMKLSHITMHPRLGKDNYSGSLYPEEFEVLLKETDIPAIFNGDLTSKADVERLLSRFPSAKGVMIGRGLLSRPSLAREIHDGTEWDRAKRIDHIMRLHDSLYDHCREHLCGEAQILSNIIPFWEYLEGEIGRKSFKKIRKAVSLRKYEEAVNTIDP